MRFAGFWVRFLANLIDGVILSVVYGAILLICWIISLIIGDWFVGRFLSK